MEYSELKANLQASYGRQASARDGFAKQDWKTAERDVFLSLVQAEQAVSLLEIGAGTGQDSLYFKNNGLKPIATDLSSEMIELCREKNLTAYQMDFYDLQFPPASFDAVWSLNCLLHVPKKDLGNVMIGIKQVIKNGGLFYMGVYGGRDFEGVWEDDFYQPKRFFSFYTDTALQEAVNNCFDIVYFKAVDYGNESLHFQSMIVRNK